MYDHIGFKVHDLDASVRFYKAALAPFEYGLCSQDASRASFGPPNEPALWLYAGGKTKQNGVHLAFRANDRAAVDGFHKAGLKADGRDHGVPGLRADYSPSYYAAFLIDPDGNNVEAVCTRKEPGAPSATTASPGVR